MKNDHQIRQSDSPAGLSGPLLHGETLAAFDRIVSGSLESAPRCAAVAVTKLRPPLTCVPDLLDQVSEVLRGNPIAAERLRQTLGSLGGAAIPTPIALAVLTGFRRKPRPNRPASGQDGTNGEVTSPLHESVHARWDRLVTRQRLEPLLAAAVYVSRDVDELATMLGGVQLGLNSVDEMQTLFDLAIAGAPAATVASAFDTAIRVMSWPGTTPGEPASGGVPGVPGFAPMPGGPWPSRVPWFRWPPVPGGGELLPPPPGTPPLAPPPGLRLTEFFERCLTLEVIPNLHRLGIGFREFVTGSAGHYVIESVEPENACPGATITIRGANFDGTEAVHFVDDRGRTVAVMPSAVEDDVVTVVLPAAARTGPVSLYIPVTTRLCATTYTMARPGRPGEIRVGRASILRFEIGHSRACVAHGDPATLEWSTLPDDAQVTITRMIGGTVTVLDEDAGAVGALDLDTSSIGEHVYRIDVSNPSGTCDDASATVRLDVRRRRATRIAIMGVEITQGIQVFSLEDPPPEPNNSIDLIADMDTVLRVFVRTSHPDAGPLAIITGALHMGGHTYMPINDPSPFIPAPRAPDRTETNHSLNFLVPAGDASGTAEAVIEVFTSGSCADALETWTETLTWTDRPVLAVTIRRIADSGPDAPVVTREDAFALVRRAFRFIPSPITDIRMHRGVHQIREGTQENNYCSGTNDFYQLGLSIAYEHNDNEGTSHSTSWMGIFWRLGCTVNGIMPWPYTSTCISERDERTVAHELLHTVGLGHTVTTAGERCEDVVQPVACHILRDRTGADTNGRLNEVPFDIDANAAVPVANDITSYNTSAPRWLSAPLWARARTLLDTRY